MTPRPPSKPRRGRRGPGGPSRQRRGGGGAGKKPNQNIEPLQPTLEPPDIETFTEWDLGDEIQGAIAAMGITTPTPIQRLAIQPVLDGKDVIAKAETGTGKTLAFGAPMMARIDPDRSSVLGLALCPTRELAQQVAGVLEKLGEARDIRVALVVGGEPIHPQIDALKAGAQVVVGTPGRVLDLYGQGFLSFPWTEYVVLDEADEMLEIGFIDDVKKILSFTPDERQTLHFSATFPHDVLALARESTRDPVEIATAAGLSTVETIEQTFMTVEDSDRPLMLQRVIEQSADDDVLLVFCDRRTEVDNLMRRMERLPFSVKALHGGYDQASRFRVMSAFRTGEVKALVATDVASRGLDVDHVTHVINYSVPQDVEDYTHRIGRTGRAGRKGRAITFVTHRTERNWRDILRRMTWEIEEVSAPERTRSGGRRDGGRPARGGRDRAERPRRREARDEERPRRSEARDEERPRRSEARDDGRPRRREARDEERPRRSEARVEDRPRRGEAHEEERPRRREARDEERPRREGARSSGESQGRPRRSLSTRERLARERAGSGEATTESETTERPARRPAREDDDRGEDRPRRRRRTERPEEKDSGGDRPRREPAGRGGPEESESTSERPPREPRRERPAREPRQRPQRERGSEDRSASGGAPRRERRPETDPGTPGGFGAGV